MKFKEVTRYFDLIEQESSRTKITVLLAELFKKATPVEASYISYVSLGSLYATHITAQFNFAEKSLLKVIAILLNVSVETVKQRIDTLGDIGLIVQEGDWTCNGCEELTITHVYKKLEDLLIITGTGSQERREEYVLALLQSLDPLSAKYIVRIIIGKLRMGFSDMTLLDAFSWMERWDKSLRPVLEEAYNISVDIGLLIKTLKQDGVDGIKKLSLTPGIPIRPAAAERLPNAQAIIDKIGDCVAQPKLDGFRIQVHIDNRINNREKTPVINFFSRNLQDMSDMFPELRNAVLALDVQTLVAEGEAIAYDIETGSFLPFQETVKRKRKYDIASVAQDFPLKLYLFDILYLNGKSFLDVDHAQRRKVMLDLLDNKKICDQQIIFPIEEKKIHDGNELEAYFEQTVSIGLEGIVAKRSDAVYQAGKRNFNWIKLKRQESGSLEDTIDCVILGYYFGRGKRASFGIGALLVGVKNEHDDSFQTVAKIGTGLSDAEWIAQKKSCDEIKIPQKTHDVDCRKELYPDVWVSPKLVCMIRADEITLSPLHTAGKTEKRAGFALRFPRLMGYRPDKSASEATTIKELSVLYDHQFKKKPK